MKLLIVDDEPNFVEGIGQGINWSEYKIDEVFTALDPLIALDIAIESEPDIIITDIRMPNIDGITFIGRLRESGIRAKIIIISALEDFDYAKQAIRFHVHSYLVKPVFPRTIIKEVCDLAEQIEAERDEERYNQFLKKFYLREKQDQSHIARYIMRLALSGKDVSEHMLAKAAGEMGLPIIKRKLGVIIIKISSNPDALSNEDVLDMKDYASRHFNRMLQDEFDLFISNNEPYEVRVLYSSRLPEERISASLKDACTYISNSLKLKHSAQIIYGIGDVTDSISGIEESLASALARINRKSTVSYIKGAADDNIDKYKSDEYIESISAMLQQYEQFLSVGDYQESDHILSHDISYLFEKFSVDEEEANIIFYQLLSLILKTLLQYKVDISSFVREHQIQGVFNGSDTVTIRLLRGINESAIRIIQSGTKDFTENMIERAKHFIDSSSVGISLSEAAEYVNLSPSYFSKLFKEKEGITFVDYCKNNRVERAKQLLKSSDKKIYEISEMLGYNSVQYFTTMFKSIAGVTPTEYREQRI